MRLQRAHKRSSDQRGFTIVELLVVIVLSVLFSGMVLTFFIDFWRSVGTLENDSESLVTRQNAGDRLRSILNPANRLINQNSIPDPNADNPDPSYASGTYWEVLHAIPGTVSMPSSGTVPVFYFQAPSVDSSKNFIMNDAQPYEDQFVFYLDASTKELLMRTLANPSASGDSVTTSCPPSIATASCPADKVIASNVTSVDLRYFSLSGGLIDYTSVTDPTTGEYIGPDFPAVEVVEMTLHFERKSIVHGGYDTINEQVVRVALRNG